jgi:hypothetical protein
MIQRLVVTLITTLLVRLAESDKPILTLLLGSIGAVAAIIHLFSSVSGLEGIRSALWPVVMLGGLGAFMDFLLGKAGQSRIKSAVETLAIRALEYESRVRSSTRVRNAKIYQISLVTRVSRNSMWSRITQSLVLTSVLIYLIDFTETSSLYIALLTVLAVTSALDAAIIRWRSTKGEYGLSKLEVKEVGRLIAAARRRRDNGGDSGTFVRIFPDEAGVSTDRVWAHPEGVRS